MQRTLIRLLRFIPIPLAYAFVAPVIPFYMLFDRRGYRASYRFFRHRIGRGPIRSFFSVYANEFRLGQVVVDRFAFYAGRSFSMESDEMPVFNRLSEAEPGFVQLGSHTGNFELVGYQLRSIKKLGTLVFAGETDTVMRQRASMFSRSNVEMVPVSDDMSHLFRLNEILREGGIVSMPGDRLFGSTKSFSCPFFGEPAPFPAGPFILAASHSVPVVAVFVMKEGVRRYRVFVRPIGENLDDTQPSRVRAKSMAEAFAGCLESVVRKYPTQWFNFYDFWK
ncbi:MAG: lysophospholipid acyltransferase family protein [Bacteroidales bacterium]|nr:lysophospholipid acyltransferase family protein [Bacteroidales bacterium]